MELLLLGISFMVGIAGIILSLPMTAEVMPTAMQEVAMKIYDFTFGRWITSPSIDNHQYVTSVLTIILCFFLLEAIMSIIMMIRKKKVVFLFTTLVFVGYCALIIFSWLSSF